MRRALFLLTLVAAMVFACAGVVLAQQGERTTPERGQQSAQDDVIPNRYIVVLEDNADSQAVAREHSERYGARVSHTYRYALKGYAAELPEQALRGVRNDPRVQFVSEDREVQASAQQAPTGIRRIGASSDGVKQTLSNDGKGVGVAVIDTGIKLDHTDLKPVTNGKTCVSGTRNANDDNGHGTHVAGTIAARENTAGVVGDAPAANLYAVKVLNRNGSGTWSSVICGVDYVTANKDKIKVANMSLGGDGSDSTSDANCNNSKNDALHKAICNSVKAGVTYTVAAGNDSDDAANHVPAAYDEVITVSALSDSDGKDGGTGGAPSCRTGEKDDYLATFSNFGADVDIAAPGVCIRSTWKNGGYNTISGTSMATPHVAGAAALYIATHAGASPSAVKDGLVAAQQEDGPINGDSDGYSEGILNTSTL